MEIRQRNNAHLLFDALNRNLLPGNIQIHRMQGIGRAAGQ
jgi:hypothetical protein